MRTVHAMVWEKTEGGAFTCGPYSVVKRIDGPGWNCHAALYGDHITVSLNVTLDQAKADAEEHARRTPASAMAAHDGELEYASWFLDHNLYTEEHSRPRDDLLERIEIVAQAGLCQMTFGGAREYLKDVRDIVADIRKQPRPPR